MNPSDAEFQLDIEKMLAIADAQRTEKIFWDEFWDFLWGRSAVPVNVPLSATSSESRLRTYLDELAARCDQPPIPAQPVAGTVNFQPGQSGTSLDKDGAILLIENSLKSLKNRTVDLPIKRTSPPRPDFSSIDILLQQTIKVSDFDGLVGVYLLDLQTA